MHNCADINEQLIDLVFDEVSAEQRQRLMVELAGCNTCQAHYESTKTTLQIFDQVAERVIPDEEYWTGYEAKLRAKIMPQAQPSVWRRLADYVGSIRMPQLSLQPAFAVLMAVVIIAGLWFVINRLNSGDKDRRAKVEVIDKPITSPEVGTPDSPNVSISPPALQGTVVPVNRKQPQRPRPPVVRDVPAVRPETNIIGYYASPANPFLNPETADHLEKADLLLRTFKNAKFKNTGTDTELAYNKKQARTLLDQNMLLRRNAEDKGNLPAEELLGSLEPFLLDIANLPDRPSKDDVSTIKRRMEKDDIVAVLHVTTVSAMPAIF